MYKINSFINKGFRVINKEKYIIIFAIVIGFAFTSKLYADAIQRGIADEVIRFHVLANSDSADDQALKLMVRNAVLERFHNELSGSDNVDTTRKILIDNMNEIEGIAQNVISSQGYTYEVKAYITDEEFPTRKYGDITLPEGEYETLRVDIGSAEGHNWWCVMFPPLCYVDVSSKEVPENDKQKIKSVLNKTEYETVTGQSCKVKFRLKIAEL